MGKRECQNTFLLENIEYFFIFDMLKIFVIFLALLCLKFIFKYFNKILFENTPKVLYLLCFYEFKTSSEEG